MPWMIGGLACGKPSDRHRVISLLQGITEVAVASPAEALLLECRSCLWPPPAAAAIG